MKTLLWTIVFLLCGMGISHAERITLKSGKRITVCQTLTLGAGKIWEADGKTWIDLIRQERPTSKPLSGGFTCGDRVDVDLLHPNTCVYYVGSISKEKKSVTLSDTSFYPKP